MDRRLWNFVEGLFLVLRGQYTLRKITRHSNHVPRLNLHSARGTAGAPLPAISDARFAPSVAVARDHATAIEQSCDLSVGYDTRQLAGLRDEVDAIGTKGRRLAITSFKTPLHSVEAPESAPPVARSATLTRAGWSGRRLWQR